MPTLWSVGALYVVIAAASFALGVNGVVVSEEQLVSPRAARDALRRIGGPPPAIQCYSSTASPSLMELDNTPALVDPRRSLMGNEVLICEVPSTEPGQHSRLFTMLGTSVPGSDLVIPPQGHIPPSDIPTRSPSDALPSFDEWKLQQLEDREKRKRRRNATNTSSSTTLVPATSLPHVESTPTPTEEPDLPDIVPSAPILAVEDASAALATLKHRSNYASLDCAAAVHKANPSAKFASAILSGKKDKYMLSPCPSAMCTEAGCNEGQYVVVELCQHVRVDTLVLGNLEFFSSMFKRFEVRVASSLHAPEESWHLLGSFRARNVRGLQVFRLDRIPSSYYRYLRIDFLEHYGSEHYCPVSVLRVYGRNEREDADDDMEEDEEYEESTPEIESPAEPQQTGQLKLPEEPQTSEHSEQHPSATETRTPPLAEDTPEEMPAQPRTTYVLADLPPRALRRAPGLISVDCSATNCDELCIIEAFPGVIPRISRRVQPERIVEAASIVPNESAGTESIYRSITKRLTALETNTSLSMQYLQLSSQLLREKLVNLEHIQETKLAQLLVMLNASNAQQLAELQRRQSDEMRRIRIFFEMQSQRMETERAALLLKVEQLTREMRLEKRWGLIQLVFLLGLLAFMALTRNSMAGAMSHVPMRHDEWSQIVGDDLSRSTTPVARNNPMPGGVPGWADPWADASVDAVEVNAQLAKHRSSDLRQSFTAQAPPSPPSDSTDIDDSISTLVARDVRPRRSPFYRPVSSSRRRSFASPSPTAARLNIPIGARSEGRVRGIPPPGRAPRPLSAIDSRSDTDSVDSAN
ncbi:hypothetical protein MCUN1_001786 [Malassezia cuniculi]|uniref:SUN domain-containing protein n=1 Tax=Malassezia cuniculi TaxID=948313 RepID=A0AAF0ETH6_9BASI|nr:hypothetical protein MCUN1_001786 [Malassezia cuniculi]